MDDRPDFESVGGAPLVAGESIHTLNRVSYEQALKDSPGSTTMHPEAFEFLAAAARTYRPRFHPFRVVEFGFEVRWLRRC